MPERTPRNTGSKRRLTAPAAPAATDPADIRVLVERNYAMLRELAARKLRRSSLSRSMSPTSLVAESVVRLMKQRSVPTTVPHLSGLATILMAQALSDRAKLRRASKRRAGTRVLPIEHDVPQDRRLGRAPAAAEHADDHRSALVAEMERIGRSDPRRMEVVTLHLVLGMPLEDVAKMLSISERTAFRELAAGRAALANALTATAERKGAAAALKGRR